ncbi:MFS transporter [Microvirga sp. STR05]|uniref:MFS transporter n=1 Tax=Hymenobacter duratus TaxID=2771356 RepID=A0ABR8JJL6_9BACT|nr:MFS transporter [Hymenobacter duratus]MBD2717030.1 MFS transporter [Hymenobacter duratus]MBR7951946.1 MFS transporter [Microvirga sp. STR05]
MLTLRLPALESRPPRQIYRAAVGVLFFLMGLTFATWASRIPTIQQQLGISEARLGLLLLAAPVGSLASLPVAGWLVARLGSRRVVLGGIVGYALGLVALGLATSVVPLVAGLVLFGFVSNLSNIAVNTQAVGVEMLHRKSIMASFHGLWSLAGFAGAALGTLMIGNGVPPLAHFILVGAVVVAGVVLSSTSIRPRDAGTGSADAPLFVLPDKSLLLLGVLAFCSMICEGAMFDWSGVYFRKVVHAEKAWIGAGYTAFMCTMAGGRFIADWFAHRFGLRRTLEISGLLTAAGLLLAVALPALPTAILGFLLVGFGVSSVVPLVYGAAGRSTQMPPSLALAAVSTVGFLGFLFGPPLIGIVAGFTSLRVSFSIIAMLGLCIAALASRAKL